MARWLATMGGAALLWAAPARANMPDSFGLGARWQALGGGSVAWVDDGSAALVNPAGLQRAPSLTVGIGAFGGQPRVAPLPALAWDTNRDGAVDDRDEPLAWSARPPGVQALDLQIAGPLGPRIAAGLCLTVPTNTLLSFSTFDPQLPTYVRWANRTQRTHLALGVAAEPVEGLRLGVSVDVLAQGVATARLTLDATASGEDGASAVLDVHAIDLRVVPAWAPVLGAQVDLGELHPVLGGLALGARYHAQVGLPLDVALDAQANVNVDDLGEIEPYVAALVATADLALFDHYVPHQFDVGVGYRRSDTLQVHVDLRWADWRRLTLNVAQVNRASLLVPLLGEIDPITDGNPYQVTARATVGLRSGVELALPHWHVGGAADSLRLRLRAGFMLDPSPIVDQGPQSAILDSTHRVATTGFGLEAGAPSDEPPPLALDAMLQVHTLADGFLARPASRTTPGAPVQGAGFPIGGTFVAAGAQLRLTPGRLRRAP